MAQAGLRRRANMRQALALGLLALVGGVLAGCAETPPDASAEAGGLRPLQIVPGSLLLPAPYAAHGPLHDTCGAAALAGLVGRPRTEIPVPVDLTRRRVACTACPVAPDVRLDRVNILYDARTGLVTKITCG